MLGLRDNPIASPNQTSLSVMFNKGANAQAILEWLRKRPLRRLKLAVQMISTTVGHLETMRKPPKQAAPGLFDDLASSKDGTPRTEEQQEPTAG